MNQPDESLHGADEDFRVLVVARLKQWASRRPPESGTDLEWYYETSSALATLRLPLEHGPTFTCPACGRLADVLDAADSAVSSWVSIDVPNGGMRYALGNAEMD